MSRYIVKRLLMMIPVILGVTWFVFTLMYFTPGDPAQIILGADATEQEIQEKREELGLNGSYLERFGTYLKQVFVDGDLGTSYIYNNSIADEIAARFPNTFKIAAISVVLAVIIGLPLGVMAAVNQNTWKDNGSMFLALFGVSMPSFWFGMLMIWIFAVRCGWLPVAGSSSWKHVIMPTLTLAVGMSCYYIRRIRAVMVEQLSEEYITGCRSRGIGRMKIIFCHVLPNSLLAVVTMLGMSFGGLLGGTMIVETVFSWNGIGQVCTTAISARDYSLIQGYTMWMGFIYVIVNLLVDISYSFIDPRIRRGMSQK